MPRQPRIDILGVMYHVIARGIERRNIFRDNKDRKLFLHRFGELLKETKTLCYAWVLLPNHFHLLLMPTQSTLKRFMHKLLTGYAVQFNLRHKRSGHLFQNRYKSIICQEENYLLELIRYIHLNPLRAGLVKNIDELNRYPWSGHVVLMGKEKRYWQETKEVLFRFGRTKHKAMERYYEFVKAAKNKGGDFRYQGGGLIRSVIFPRKSGHSKHRIIKLPT